MGTTIATAPMIIIRYSRTGTECGNRLERRQRLLRGEAAMPTPCRGSILAVLPRSCFLGFSPANLVTAQPCRDNRAIEASERRASHGAGRDYWWQRPCRHLSGAAHG